jgi:2-C-methyl-D-erythritol 4-phosphate cytidylyltransferase
MGGVDKIMAPLCGRPLVTHSLDAFESSPLIARIVLVVPPAGVDAHRDLVGEHGYSRIEVVPGGERRQDSVRSGLDALGAVEWTIVHDGARPCIDGEVIETGLQAAKSTGAAAPAQPLSDTIKEVDGSGMVVRTLDRGRLRAAQTPQVFSTALLRQAHDQVREDVTDDAAMIEMTGGSVRLFPGSPENLKVTTPLDLEIAEAILRRRGGRS